MNRRLVLLSIGSFCLASCGLSGNRRRIGNYHAMRYVDGSIMFVYLIEGGNLNGPSCGLDFYNKYTNERQSVTPMNYGVTKKYIVIESNADEMARWWLVPNELNTQSTKLGPFLKLEAQERLAAAELKWPKLKAA